MYGDPPGSSRPSPGPGSGAPGERLSPEPEQSEGRSPTAGPGALDFLTMGTAIVLCLVLGGGVGYLLDDIVHTAPLLTFVGLALGVAGAVAVTVSHVRRFL